jgi:hypothetical protein
VQRNTGKVSVVDRGHIPLPTVSHNKLIISCASALKPFLKFDTFILTIKNIWAIEVFESVFSTFTVVWTSQGPLQEGVRFFADQVPVLKGVLKCRPLAFVHYDCPLLAICRDLVNFI